MNDREPMRLGQMIEMLAKIPADHSIRYDFGRMVPTTINSYRGDYQDLAIGHSEPFEASGVTVGILLRQLREAVGRVFQGYKGGDYLMDEEVGVWVGNWGYCSDTAIVGVTDCGFEAIIDTAYYLL